MAGTLAAIAANAQQPAAPQFGGDGVLTSTAIRGASRSAGLSGNGALLATAVNAFTPFTDDNIDRSKIAVPANTSGCWVTLIGAGGAGGIVTAGVAGFTYGGGGGGGGGRIPRVFIPVANLGAIYSVTRGLGVAGNPGQASEFSSGSIILTASGGGYPGVNPFNSNSFGANGSGGSCTVTGMSATSFPGGAGGGDPRAPGSDGNGGGAGGGGGGWAQQGSSSVAGANGGASSGVAGGTGGVAAQAGNPGGTQVVTAGGGSGGGGAGGSAGTSQGGLGGQYGGGSGGAGGQQSGSVAASRAGGSGFTRVEWV